MSLRFFAGCLVLGIIVGQILTHYQFAFLAGVIIGFAMGLGTAIVILVSGDEEDSY